MVNRNEHWPEDVFILGAGASYPYCMPLGKELKELILSFKHIVAIYEAKERVRTQNSIGGVIMGYPSVSKKALPSFLTEEQFAFFSNEAFNFLDCSKTFFDIQELKNFLNKFEQSNAATIDTFLSVVKDANESVVRGQGITRGQLFQIIGKLLIGFCIGGLAGLSLEKTLCRKDISDDWIEYFINQEVAFFQEEFCDNPPGVINFNYDKIFQLKIQSFLEQSGKKAHSLVKMRHIHVYGEAEHISGKLSVVLP